MPAGSGPPRHRHNCDECFYVLEGSVEIQVAGVAVAPRGPGEVLGEISLLEACTFLHRSFAELYPEHRCTRHCHHEE